MRQTLSTILFLSFAAAQLPPQEKTALIALCNNIPNWCPSGYANLDYDYCVQLGPYVLCTSNTVTSIVLENVPGVTLTGVLPTQLGLLTNLQKLYARSNSLSGYIPTQLGDTKLYDVNLNGNAFIGRIPSELGKLNLVGFEASNNVLDGQIPPQIFRQSLQNLNLGSNSLSGTIPTEIGVSSNLAFLELNGNKLTGSIPSHIGALSNCFKFFVNANLLTGTLPSQIGKLTSVGALSLSDNDITGQIPSEIGSLKPNKGSFFFFGSNDFTGTLPTEIGRLTTLTMLAIYDNPRITGTMPSEIGLMTSAQTLWLFGNSIYDRLPTTLNQLSTNLISLRVHKNLLSGSIPNLANAFGGSRGVSYQELQLQNNYFTGSLPTYFGSQVVFNCETTFMDPPDICRFTLRCNNTVQERVSDFDVTGMCVSNTGVLSGTLRFTPASVETCFAEYLFYFASNFLNPLTTTPAFRVPKTPKTSGGSLAVSVNGVAVGSAAYLLAYSWSGVPASATAITNTPAQLAISTIASCSSATRTPTPSRSFSRSPTRSPQVQASKVTDDGSGSGGSNNNNTIGIAIAVVLIVVAAVIIAFVVIRRRRRYNRTIISPSSKGYDDNAL